jgi:hypothetical protein
LRRDEFWLARVVGGGVTSAGQGDQAGVAEDGAEPVQDCPGFVVHRGDELQLAYPTFTEAVSVAAQKICRTVGIGSFPQAWSYLGPEE